MVEVTRRRSPLHDLHARLGARFVEFGGWEMPVQYQSVLAEHQAVRQRVGVFDVTHLGRFRFAGEGTTSVLRHLLCNDVTEVEPGRAQYTMALNQKGGVIDDIIVWRWEDDSYWVLPNAANYDRVVKITAAGGVGELDRVQESTVMLAVQGPDAPELLESVLGSTPKRFQTMQAQFRGAPIWAAGTGYTGERGAEVCAPAEAGAVLLEVLVEAGATPCGLGARDTLRLEAGLPLWGQDLDEQTSPLEAGLGWVVSWDHDFVGKEALVDQRDGGLSKALVAFSLDGRQIPRHGYRLRAGESTGSVSSGNFSPLLGQGIGIGYLAPPDDGSPIEVEIRGEWVMANRAKLPFVGIVSKR